MNRRKGNRKKKIIRFLMASFIILGCLPVTAFAAKEEETIKRADGLYQINGKIVKALDPGTLSMADGALEYTVDENAKKVKCPLHIVIRDGQAYVRMRFAELKSELGEQPVSGYLGELKYYPNFKKTDAVPGEEEELSDAIVEYRYQGYDQYNDPDVGSDSYMKGTAYPEQVLIPIEDGETEIWLKIYVPVMEAISSGSGTQQVRLRLDWSKDSLVQVQDESINVSGLADQIHIAKALEKGNISDTVWEEFQKVLADADAVYNNLSATQEQVDTQLILLKKTMDRFRAENGDATSKIAELSDGVYFVNGQMLKTDKSAASMSNNAINHTIKLTVKDGQYDITMNFNSLQFAGRYGYLGALKYFRTGYTTNKYGVPQGDLANVKIDSYQTDKEGSRIKDSFGTDYPDSVTFNLIPEALKDGYIPLQVFVPVMESIASGAGTQTVYLKLDWNSLKSADADDPSFQNDEKNEKWNDGNSKHHLTGGSSLWSGSLPGHSKPGTLKLGFSGSGLGSLLLKSRDGLASVSSVKTDDNSFNRNAWVILLTIGFFALLTGITGKKLQKRRKENHS